MYTPYSTVYPHRLVGGPLRKYCSGVYSTVGECIVGVYPVLLHNPYHPILLVSNVTPFNWIKVEKICI